MPQLLDVKNLTIGIGKNDKIYNAVEGINFSIDEGEIAGLAGESGCGKTITALSILNLLPYGIKITDGEIIYNGQVLTSMDEKQMRHIRGREISMVFQDIRQSLNPLMKVGGQIIEMLELKNKYEQIKNDQKVNKKIVKKQNKSKVFEMLTLLGFENPQKIYNAYPHQLSGGMCQRILTAIAVICNPRLLLADEPSSSLDEESQERILSLIMDMNRTNKTSVLIISHDLSIIQKYCSRYLIMYAGKIIEEGPAASLYSPLHPYTKALINAIPEKEKRGQYLENIPGKVPSIEDRIQGCPFAPRCGKAQRICTETFPSAKLTANRKVHCYFPQEDTGFAEIPCGTGDSVG